MWGQVRDNFRGSDSAGSRPLSVYDWFDYDDDYDDEHEHEHEHDPITIRNPQFAIRNWSYSTSTHWKLPGVK
jgi:hypothetical protein